MGIEAIIFAVDLLVTAFCIFMASKLSFIDIEFKSILGISALVAVVSLIPSIGWVLGLILFVYLIHKVAGVSFVDCVWLIAFTKLMSMVFNVVIMSLFI